MSRRTYSPARLSIADLAGIGAVQLAVVLAFFDWRWAMVPPALYVAFTLVAPFLPQLGYFLPVITHGPAGHGQLALTFDDGPHPETTPGLLELLAEHGLKATFFVVGRQCEEHPELLEQILAAGHDVGNHTYGHDVLFALRSAGRVRDEVRRCQEVLALQNVRTLAFRPPVSITNPRLWPALQAEDLVCVQWRKRGGDAGNRRVRGLARRVLSGVRDGDIVLLHDCPPTTGVALWHAELEQLLKGLAARELKPVSLSTLLQVDVTEPADEAAGSGPVRRFYDRLAPRYDDEQEQRSMSPVRLQEQRVIAQTVSGWEPGAVLELGAGSGRFTLELARRAERVVAVDASPRMLALLEEKAAAEGLENVEPVVGDFTTVPLQGPFTHVCAFSSLEYVADLDALLERIARHTEPGGLLYFTTARRSPLRFFTQLGNALRQGLWLHARGARELRRSLEQAGFTDVELRMHGMRWVPGCALLWEVTARRAG